MLFRFEYFIIIARTLLSLLMRFLHRSVVTCSSEMSELLTITQHQTLLRDHHLINNCRESLGTFIIMIKYLSWHQGHPTFWDTEAQSKLWTGERNGHLKINDIPNHLNYYVIDIYIYIFTIYKFGHAQHNTAWWAAGWFKQAKPELKLGPSTEIVISNTGCFKHFNIQQNDEQPFLTCTSLTILLKHVYFSRWMTDSMKFYHRV